MKEKPVLSPGKGLIAFVLVCVLGPLVAGLVVYRLEWPAGLGIGLAVWALLIVAARRIAR